MSNTMRRAALLAGLTLFVAACTGGGPGAPILANAPVTVPSLAPATPAPSRAPDPLPVVLPRDDAPHDRLTEWWYYTGHLRSDDGSRFGFEFVIFRAERGRFPVSWASHLAITDETGNQFHYAQRQEIGSQVDRSLGGNGAAGGFDLAIAGGYAAIAGPAPTADGTPAATASATPAGATPAPTPPAASGPIPPWTMAGSDGSDHLAAALTSAEATASGSPGGLGLDLALTATKPPALHGGNGWIDFGPAGSSYYYSRTSMTATGRLTVDGHDLRVEGTAWFDHQWGDFIAVGGGGWDWFAVNLDDRTDLTLSLVRDADGSYPLVYGTLVERDGTVTHLDREAFQVTVTDRWRSPTTGADYPAAWTVRIPSRHLTIDLHPTVAAQELDTRATTGVVYWEGSQVVHAARDGRALRGEAYVELTGYAPSAISGS
jgi:predicted secreted hydrolase